MRVVFPDNTFITPIDKYGRITNQQICIYAKSGYNKGCIGEGIVEWFHKHNYLIIIIQDPKDEIEYGYQMFLPEEQYHLDHLNLISQYVGKWKLPSKKNVKLYHPFTFSLPTNRLLPKMNIFTIPFKSLGRAEWGLLSEVKGENETVSVLLKASEEINNEEGIYSFAHYVQDSVKGKGNIKNRKADWKNFGLEATSGTMKELSKVSNILRPFKKHFFLTHQNCEYNLNWKDILTDQKNYHVFISNFISRRKEEKVVDFLTLYLLENIIKNKKYLNHPVLIVMPEISITTPYKPEGHKEFLANSIKKGLKTIRSEGKGMSSLIDTQVFNDVDEDVRGSSTVNLFGELGDIKDIENVCKALGWGKKEKEQLNKAEIPRTYLIRGIEEGNVDDGGYLFFYPSAMHCEPHYNFEEMYRKHNKENPEEYPLVSYKEIYEKMKKIYKDDEEKMKKKVRKKEKEIEEAERKKKEEKEEKKQESENKESKKSKTNIPDEYKYKRAYELRQEGKSWNYIGQELGFSKSSAHKTAKKYSDKWEEKLKEDEGKDFEEKVLEDLKGGE